MFTKYNVYFYMTGIVLAVIAIFWSFMTLHYEHHYDLEIVRDYGVFKDTDHTLQPNDSVEKTLEIKNNSDRLVKYQIYLENLNGNFDEHLIFNIYQSEQLLYSQTALNFNREHPFVSQQLIKPGDIHHYQIEVYVSKEAGNEYQNQLLTFDIVLETVNDY